MSVSKYRQTYQEMIDLNQPLFAEFLKIHDNYRINKKKFGSQFHQIGERVVEIIRNYERVLCAKMERGSKGKYSSKVSDKFWQLVRKDYPLIDLVGVRSSFE